jgi:hypothetical protein
VPEVSCSVGGAEPSREKQRGKKVARRRLARKPKLRIRTKPSGSRCNRKMVQGGGRAGFAAKSFQGLRVLRQILRQKLQSDEAAQHGVFRFVDHAHSTTAEFLDDAVMGDSLTNERVGAGHVPQILFGSYCHVNEAEPMRFESW